MEIGHILAGIRERMGLSQRELAQQLTEHGVPVSNQAISKWENGLTQPNATQFLTLCQVLRVQDVMSVFTGRRSRSPLDALSAEGQKKVEEYIRLLIQSGMYAPEAAPAKVVELRSLPLYHISVSAGTGQFLDSDHYDLVEVGSEVPMSANFGVRIAGNSMEPRFVDGQIVWVHQQQTVVSGEIGIFLYEGNAYCKKFSLENGSIRLLSLNSLYPPMEIPADSDLRVFGRVVG